MDEKLNIKNAPKYTVNRMVELATRIKLLEQANEIYDKQSAVKEDMAKAKKDLAEIKSSVISEINSRINTKIYELNKVINIDGRSAPVMDLREGGYDFRGLDDTGTGRAYVNLLIFDLAIFSITQLPILIHDTLLFKNVENVAIERIVDIYSKQTKQVFIAIDEINKYDNVTEKILNEHSVLKLAYDKTLFIKDWKKK